MMNNNELIQWLLLEEADDDDILSQFFVNQKPKSSPLSIIQ